MGADRLPNLLIAGVSRAGTGALFAYLGQHHQIYPSLVKEPGYFLPIRFAERELPPLDTYTRCFRHWAGERWLMEATPGYLYGGSAMIATLNRVLGPVRVIVSLRDPVQRLWSYYQYMSSRANIPGNPTFGAYIDRAQELRREGTAWTREHRAFWALSGGFYSDFLDEWLDAFGDAFKLVFFEHLTADPQQVVADICAWLDLDAEPTRSFRYGVVHASGQYKSLAVQQRAVTLRRRAEPLLRHSQCLQALARRAVRRMNRSSERSTLDLAARERLDDLYRPANQRLAIQLRARGITQLPQWLDACDSGPQVPGHPQPWGNA